MRPFARVSADHDYAIVPAGLIDGDEVYRSLTTRDGLSARASPRRSVAQRYGDAAAARY